MGKFEILLDKARIEVGILKDNGFSTGNIERAMGEWLRQSQETPTEGFTKVEDKFIDWYQVEIHSGRIPYAISIIEKFRQLREEGNANPLDARVIKTEADTVNTISANQRAKRWAMMNFDKWNEVTGFVDPHISYYDEITALIEDAVEFGYGVALKQPLKEIMKVIKKSEGSL